MLAGGTEPFPIWDQHEWRPQAGGVVSTVAQVAQQNLKQQMKPAVILTTSVTDDGSNPYVAVTNNHPHWQNLLYSNKCLQTGGGSQRGRENTENTHSPLGEESNPQP